MHLPVEDREIGWRYAPEPGRWRGGQIFA